jgi:hypothetical protein
MNSIEIANHLESIIPNEMLEKYEHLSYAEMAEVDDLAEWADELREAEKSWWS